MINADFWDVSTMDIRGPIHRNGVILKNSFIFKETLPQQALSFIALTKDNKMVIADSVEYRGMQYNLKEVTGAELSCYGMEKYPARLIQVSIRVLVLDIQMMVMSTSWWLTDV